MTYDTFIGVDPGANGALAIVYREFEDASFHSTKEPLKLWFTFAGNAFGLIERVHAMPNQGVTSMFSFGENYGMLQAMLQDCLGDHWDYVTPQTWQKHFKLIKHKGETKTQKKNRHKALAQRLFPDIKVTHQNADALLIASYCREIHS